VECTSPPWPVELSFGEIQAFCLLPFDLLKFTADINCVQGNDLRLEEEFEKDVKCCVAVSIGLVVRNHGYIPAKIPMFKYEVKNVDTDHLPVVKTSNPEVNTIIVTMNNVAQAV
jgi:hypothetical protein